MGLQYLVRDERKKNMYKVKGQQKANMFMVPELFTFPVVLCNLLFYIHEKASLFSHIWHLPIHS